MPLGVCYNICSICLQCWNYAMKLLDLMLCHGADQIQWSPWSQHQRQTRCMISDTGVLHSLPAQNEAHIQDWQCQSCSGAVGFASIPHWNIVPVYFGYQESALISILICPWRSSCPLLVLWGNTTVTSNESHDPYTPCSTGHQKRRLSGRRN